MSRVHFQWQHTGTVTTAPKRNQISLVRVPHSLRALDVQMRQPQQSKWYSLLDCNNFNLWIQAELGTTSHLLLVISTGRNDISRATIKLTPPSGVQFNYSAARLEAEGQCFQYILICF